jgi:hypothetical protein
LTVYLADPVLTEQGLYAGYPTKYFPRILALLLSAAWELGHTSTGFLQLSHPENPAVSSKEKKKPAMLQHVIWIVSDGGWKPLG